MSDQKLDFLFIFSFICYFRILQKYKDKFAWDTSEMYFWIIYLQSFFWYLYASGLPVHVGEGIPVRQILFFDRRRHPFTVRRPTGSFVKI